MKLIIWRALPGSWMWLLADGDRLHDVGFARSWPQALAVGSAALDVECAGWVR